MLQGQRSDTMIAEKLKSSTADHRNLWACVSSRDTITLSSEYFHVQLEKK